MILRPKFTQQLTQQLLAGENINLISAHGQGRRRTLQDLRTLLPDNFYVEQRDCLRQGDAPHDLEPLETEKNTPKLLILHNFDACSDVSLWKSLFNGSDWTVLTVSEQASLAGFQNIKIPKITEQQLLDEVLHLGLVDCYTSQSLVAWLLKQPNPYTLLDEKDTDWFRSKLWQAL